MSARRTQAADRLFELQNSLAESLESRLKALLGPLPRRLQRYETQARVDYSAIKPKQISRQELIRAIRASSVTFLGDFHSLEQAQRTALRILRSCVRSGEDWVLGVEFFGSQYQTLIDRWAAGEISSEELVERTRFKQDWGFNWKHFEPILIWARDHGVKILALNQPKTLPLTLRSRKNSDPDLESRDRWAAGIITDQFDTSGRSPRRAIVLYGDLHIGRRHLPRQLELVSRRYLGWTLDSISIHQNPDCLYRRLKRERTHADSQIYSLKDRVYGLISAPPWAMAHSMLEWVEAAVESEHDPLETMSEFEHRISQFLHLPSRELDVVEFYSIDHLSRLERSFYSSRLRSRERSWLQGAVKSGDRIVLSEAGIAFSAFVTPNVLADLASQVLFDRFWPSSLTERAPLEVVAGVQLLRSAFSFLGSMIINPRRKTDLPEDQAHRIQELKRTAKRARERGLKTELAQRQLALKWMKRAERLEMGAILKEFDGSWNHLVALRSVGHWMGRRIFRALLEDKISADMLVRLFLSYGRQPQSDLEVRLSRVFELGRAARRERRQHQMF